MERPSLIVSKGLPVRGAPPPLLMTTYPPLECCCRAGWRTPHPHIRVASSGGSPSNLQREERLKDVEIKDNGEESGSGGQGGGGGVLFMITLNKTESKHPQAFDLIKQDVFQCVKSSSLVKD